MKSRIVSPRMEPFDLEGYWYLPSYSVADFDVVGEMGDRSGVESSCEVSDHPGLRGL